MYFVLVLNFKMPTIVGILQFMTKANYMVCCSKQENNLFCCVLLFIKIKFSCESSMNFFLNLGANDVISVLCTGLCVSRCFKFKRGFPRTFKYKNVLISLTIV